MNNQRRQYGFTLMEVIIFIVVVSVGLTGILVVSTQTTKASADPMVRKQAMALADSILEEILLKAYCDPDTVNLSTVPATCGVNTVEASRDLYDAVDDYNGQTKTIFTDWPSSLNSYDVAITVTATTLGVLPAKRVTVTVSGGANVVSISGYRTNYW